MTIHIPSCDQSTGFLNGESPLKSSCSGAASFTVLTNRLWPPSRSAAHTTREPSGDQTGLSLRPRPEESGVAPPRLRSTSQMSDSDGDVDRTSAPRDPSGEIVIDS